MEKLIELLNEFSPEDFNWCERNGKIYDRQEMYEEADVFIEMWVYVISKQFWFIKWLVENEKIDFDSDIEFYFLQREQHTKVESLLMLLSIQDNPIEFLCSILK